MLDYVVSWIYDADGSSTKSSLQETYAEMKMQEGKDGSE